MITFFLNFWRNQSIIVVQLIVLISISISILLVMDVVQNKQLKDRLSKKTDQELENMANEHSHDFDIYLQSIYHSLKYISTNLSLTHYINNYSNDTHLITRTDTNKTLPFSHKPPIWLPKSWSSKSYFKSNLTLLYKLNPLLSYEDSMISAYFHKKIKPQQSASFIKKVNYFLERYKTNQLNNNEHSFIVEINSIPHIISSLIIKNSNNQLFNLVLVTALDNQFLKDVMMMSYDHYKCVISLINSKTHQILSSSNNNKINVGLDVRDYSPQYLFAGKPYIKKTASSLQLQLYSLISHQDVDAFYKQEISQVRKQRFILAALLILAFSTILYYLISRIKKLTQYIQNMQHKMLEQFDFPEPIKNKLTGDEILILYKQFNLFIKTIELNHKKLHLEILERRNKEKELSLAILKAEKANHSKSEFLSSMSHELRTPLNAILGFSQLLSYDESLSKLQLENVKKIYSSGNYLLGLINDVLDLTRIEEGKLSIHLETTNINDLLKECHYLTSAMAEKANVKIYYQPKKIEANDIKVDSMRLKQIILNLVSNAIKYHHSKEPIVWLNCAIKNKTLNISVKDNGKGIDQKQIKNLFEPFNRLGAEKSHIEGTGVGLYITHQLIRMMGGTITVDSSFGEGTVFNISIPLNGVEYD